MSSLLQSLLFGWHTSFLRFQGARPDHVLVESLSCCFPRDLISIVHPRELDCFEPWHMTRSCPIKKAFEFGGIPYNKIICSNLKMSCIFGCFNTISVELYNGICHFYTHGSRETSAACTSIHLTWKRNSNVNKGFCKLNMLLRSFWSCFAICVVHCE